MKAKFFSAALFLVLCALAVGYAQQPPWTLTNPSILRTAGGSSTTYIGGGLIAQGRSTTDSATTNTWNTTSVTIPANTLNSASDSLVYETSALGANNTNTHEFQIWFSLATATCTGTSANACNSGCAIMPAGVTNTTAFAFYNTHAVLARVTSSTEDFQRTHGGTSLNWSTGGCSIDLTQDTKVSWAIRNTTTNAASLAQLTYWLWYYPHP